MFKKIKYLFLLLILILPILVTACGSGSTPVAETSYTGDISYYTLSIGNGNFSYLKQGDKAIVIDAGIGLTQKNKPNSVEIHDSRAKNWGSASQKSYQWVKNTMVESGVKEIETIFISHDHSDHYNQLFNLANDIDFNVKNVVLPLNYGNADKQLRGLENFKGNIDTSFSKAYNFLDIKFENLTAFADRKNLIEEASTDPNASTMVLRFEVNGKVFLYTGDITLSSDKKFIAKMGEKPVDIYVMPHHGGNSINGKLVEIIGNDEEAVFISGTGSDKWANFTGGTNNIFPRVGNIVDYTNNRVANKQIYITGEPIYDISDVNVNGNYMDLSDWIGGIDRSYEYRMTQTSETQFLTEVISSKSTILEIESKG
ncbi:MBL fold metallo-hydrolase [[Acholeplasma] multilocale]|uniref:MBL fold metallo-hydrolase n=1 Tax=[Acholeplasma] multilocale TaxID=264638 RepID=UPI00047B4FC0|nr:MBL fold metallo-hydrolase [[Acholeplasma] multilocale]